MALSRIWSAFIIIAIFVAGYNFLFNKSRDDIFNRMVSGTAKDEYKYAVIGDSVYSDRLKGEMKDYGFMQQRTIEDFDGHTWEVFYMDISKFPTEQTAEK